jgi:predicted ATP-grasp superfamily ATP-dependent carboligase
MRLFAYEYMTAVGPRVERESSLCTEGWAMLSAVVEDFGRIPDVNVTTLVHTGCGRRLGQACMTFHGGDEESVFKRLAAEADFSLVIAPEFDGLLLERCRWACEAGGRSLGSSPGAVALAGDKFALSAHFQKREIPTPATVLLTAPDDRMDSLSGSLYPAVCKPRHGAGSQATFLVQNVSDLAAALEQAALEMPDAELIIQPLVPGQSASIAFLIGPGTIHPLLPATQELSRDGRFHYRGGQLPLPANLKERAICLGRRAVAAVPGLMGYVGVDLILGDSADGTQDSVIEVNPRLTTSYIGLRRLARGNLAEAVLATVMGAMISELEWHPGRLDFRSDGRVEFV